MMEGKGKRITEMSDSEFLSFLYAEREREESLSTYQGWNNWAVAGASITVMCAGYSVLSKSRGDIDVLNMAYCLSGLISILLAVRPFILLLSRKRGVDYSKVKTLKEVAPKHHLGLAIICSLFFSVFIPVVNKEKPFNVISLTWIITALIYLATSITVYVNRNKVVRPDINGLIFTRDQWERRFGAIMGGALSILWVQSFKDTHGPLIGSPDFELAVCLAAMVALLYLLAKINIGDPMSARLDVLIDDYLYNGRSKESIYQQILIRRMGYGVFEACAKELLELDNSYRGFESQKKRIEDMGALFASGSFDRNQMNNYFDVIQEALDKSKKWNDQILSLGAKLKELTRVEPELADTEEYKKLSAVKYGLMEMSNDLMRVTNDAANKMIMWVGVYHCKKYGGWCIRECEERYGKPSLRYRFERWCMKVCPRLSSVVRVRKPCKKCEE